MTNTATTSPVDTRRQDNKRKRRALLAGGLVLGLGAAATFAAWTDEVWSMGAFKTGTFNLVGSANGTSWSEFVVEGNAYDMTTPANVDSVHFKMNSLNMSPGETVLAPFFIATESGSTLDGRVWLQEAKVSGPLGPLLSYKIVESATCVADDPATALNEMDATGGFNPTDARYSHTFTSASQTFAQGGPNPGNNSAVSGSKAEKLTANGGNVFQLCIGVTLKDEAQVKANIAAYAAANPGATYPNTDIHWRFTGDSKTFVAS